ncbi:MAG: D-alanyl-D-alanine carboxypeptidase [Oscillospiraceae bacterium]|nr:D-alanyl-D-alanine carboxypeptidase [Oscillospiraceae bacterium]
MRRFFKLFAAALLILLCIPQVMAAPSVISESAVLMDADTGQILYNKDMHAKRYPASITKIATVICGLENGSLADKIVMTDEAVFSVSRDSSHIALDVGEEITLEQACYAALMMSANDACNGIAEACAGTIPAFVDMMNEMAVRAGAVGTHFANANGLRDSNHYTTAFDMASICRYAIKNKDFRKIFGTYKYTMPPNNKQPEQRNFINQHSMISDPAFLYDGIVGGKAGWTTDAQFTLVTAAEREGKTLIAVVMKSPRNNDKYTDTKALLDYGFESFDSVAITSSDLPRREGYRLSAPINLSVKKGTTREDLVISTTMENGEDFVVVSYSDGEEIGKFPCSVAIDVSVPTSAAEEPEKGFSIWSVLGVLGLILLSLIALFLLLVLAIIIRKKIYRARRRRRRRRRK